MKKLFFLIMGLCVLGAGEGYAYSAADGIAWRAARQGNIALIGNLGQVAAADVLYYRDAQGNNVFHEARDLSTFQALENAFCAFYPADCRARVDALLDETNSAQETALRRQLNLGRADVYLQYIGRTALARHIVRARKADAAGGLLAVSIVPAEREKALQKSRDASGLTDAQMARRLRANYPQMKEVEESFRLFAPYML